MSAVYMLIRKLNFVGSTSVDTNLSIKVVTNHICTLSELCFIHNSCTFALFKVDITLSAMYSITYYLELCNAIIVYCTSHLLNRLLGHLRTLISLPGKNISNSEKI